MTNRRAKASALMEWKSNATPTTADGKRLSKTVNGVTTEFIYSGDTLAGFKRGNDTLMWLYGADELACGDKVVLYGGQCAYVEKVSIEHLITAVKVYNFEVEDFHTYFVGDNSVLVHNKGCRLNKINEKYLKKLNLDAHKIKKEFLGKRANISHFDLAVDKKTGIIYIIDKAGKIVEKTWYTAK